jgi:hypothetical protein
MDLMNFGVMLLMSMYPLSIRLWNLASSQLFHLAMRSVVPVALDILCNEMKNLDASCSLLLSLFFQEEEQMNEQVQPKIA